MRQMATTAPPLSHVPTLQIEKPGSNAWLFLVQEGLLSFLHFDFFNFRTVEQLDQRHRSIVADAEAEL